MVKETRDAREEREDAERDVREAKDVRNVGEPAPKGAAKGAAVRAELQNLKDRVAANQADQIAASFAKLDALLGDA